MRHSNCFCILAYDFYFRFVKRPDEEKFYFNIDLDLRLRMLQKFKSAGVSKIFCGHYHRNAGGWDQDMELVVTSAVGAQVCVPIELLTIFLLFDTDTRLLLASAIKTS